VLRPFTTKDLGTSLENTQQGLFLILFLSADTRTEKKLSQKDENQCFDFNRIDTQQGILPEELQPCAFFSILLDSLSSFDVSFYKWCLGKPSNNINILRVSSLFW